MDWPENLPPIINMQLDMSKFTAWKSIPPKLIDMFPKIGVFEKRDIFFPIEVNGRKTTAQVYELVDVR